MASPMEEARADLRTAIYHWIDHPSGFATLMPAIVKFEDQAKAEAVEALWEAAQGAHIARNHLHLHGPIFTLCPDMRCQHAARALLPSEGGERG